jgi:D-serine deaminase-like pyridoxal phosphate-dependent protein
MFKATSRHLKSLGLTGPSFVIDEARARANIRVMAAKARRSRVAFRPHFKTHQSPVVARWFADEGVDRITVSSVRMAEQFAETGWTDITIAFLVNPLEGPRLDNLARYLAEKGGRLGLTVDSVAAAGALTGLKAEAWVKIDTGYGRTGVPWDAVDDLGAVLDALENPVGLLTHSGNSYAARNGVGLEELYSETVDRLATARAALERPDLKLSVGDTPTCSVVAEFPGVDEVRPGNFVFYDLMQLQIGSCLSDRLAAAAACPVVGLYPDRGRIAVHGGAVHLSREYLETAGGPIFGRLGALDLTPGEKTAGLGRVIEDAPVVSLSQEHGLIEAPGRIIEEIDIGDLLLIWPVHSCLTCDLMGRDAVILPGIPSLDTDR